MPPYRGYGLMIFCVAPDLHDIPFQLLEKMGLLAHLCACGQGRGLHISAMALQAGQLAAQHMRQQRAPPAQVCGLQGCCQRGLHSPEDACLAMTLEFATHKLRRHHDGQASAASMMLKACSDEWDTAGRSAVHQSQILPKTCTGFAAPVCYFAAMYFWILRQGQA